MYIVIEIFLPKTNQMLLKLKILYCLIQRNIGAVEKHLDKKMDGRFWEYYLVKGFFLILFSGILLKK